MAAGASSSETPGASRKRLPPPEKDEEGGGARNVRAKRRKQNQKLKQKVGRRFELLVSKLEELKTIVRESNEQFQQNMAALNQMQEEYARKLHAMQEDIARISHAFYGLPVPRKHMEHQLKARYQLHFTQGLPNVAYSSKPIEVVIAIIDTERERSTVTNGCLSTARVEVLILDDKFCANGQQSWTQQEFSSHIVSTRQGEEPLLSAVESKRLVITLNKGVGQTTVKFNRRSDSKFKLAVRLHPDEQITYRVQEGISDPIRVMHKRSELNRKQDSPSLADEVYFLKKIGKNGPIHQTLVKHGIRTVQQFLEKHAVDPEGLRCIIDSGSENGISNKLWNEMVEHAKKCLDQMDEHDKKCPRGIPSSFYRVEPSVYAASLSKTIATPDSLSSLQPIPANRETCYDIPVSEVGILQHMQYIPIEQSIHSVQLQQPNSLNTARFSTSSIAQYQENQLTDLPNKGVPISPINWFKVIAQVKSVITIEGYLYISIVEGFLEDGQDEEELAHDKGPELNKHMEDLRQLM